MNKKNTGINKLYYSFILFFLLSVVFWFMTKLSKEYEGTIKFPVIYNNLPDNKLLQENPLDLIDIHVRASGFKLISSKISPKKLEIDASNLYSKSLTDYYLLISQQKLGIQKQMITGIEIDHFIKDSIAFNLGVLKVKKIPVKLVSDLTFANGYELNEAIHIEPDSIEIKGPESILDTISFVSTTLFQKKQLNSSIKEVISIEKFSRESNIRTMQHKVEISASVEEFTEGEVEVPINLLNPPNNASISTFPKLVKITYKVALSNFNKVSSSAFLIECDYNMSKVNNLPYLIPKLVEISSLVRNVRISPMKIDFIINK